MANIFPRWSNLLPLKIAICIGLVATTFVAGFTVYATPKTQRVGYQPRQPIPYNHELHVEQLGLDCRYCHSYVDKSGHANIPTASVCWNCHQHVQKGSEKLAPLRAAMGVDENHSPIKDAKPKPIEWVRVHSSPDYVYFNHSAHVNRGISCKSCHGQVNKMPVVYQAENHSMGWCLECHRAPENHLRPLEEVYNLNYKAKDYLAKNYTKLNEQLPKNKQISYDPDMSEDEAQKKVGTFLKAHWNVKPKQSCATCHR